MDDHEAFVGDKLAVGPVASLELGEDKHALVAYLEGTCPGNLLEIWRSLVLIWNQVVVKVEWKILLGDLVFHYHCIWNSIYDAGSNLLEELKILGFIVTGVPTMLLTVLAKLDHKDDVFVTTFKLVSTVRYIVSVKNIVSIHLVIIYDTDNPFGNFGDGSASIGEGSGVKLFLSGSLLNHFQGVIGDVFLK